MLDGHEFYGYLPGGASGGILPASMATCRSISTRCSRTAASSVLQRSYIFDRDRAADAARNLMKFFQDESCGQCTPCRVGTAKALTLMEATQWNQPLLEELSQAMMDASICGLGQAAPNPALTVMRYFPQEVGGGRYQMTAITNKNSRRCRSSSS